MIQQVLKSLTIGSRCSNASPVREPTAMLTQNWMLSWNTLVQEVHRSTTMPNTAVRVITTFARVAYKYPKTGKGRVGKDRWSYWHTEYNTNFTTMLNVS